MDNYLVKPVEPMDILNKVATLLNNSDNGRHATKKIAKRKKSRALNSAHV